MRGLKALVIGMGVLIVAGLVVVVVTLADRAGELSRTVENAGFGTASLGLPAGSEIVALAPAGDRLAVHVRVPGEGDRIVFVDPASGESRGTLTLD